jgi:hypothetical protein
MKECDLGASVVLQLLDRVANAERRLASLENLAERVAEIETKGIEFCGIYQRAMSYRRGSMTIFGGSLYAATRNAEPGEAPSESAAWQLCAKAGRDGKDAR